MSEPETVEVLALPMLGPCIVCGEPCPLHPQFPKYVHPECIPF